MELGNIKNLKRIGNTISKNNNGKGTDFICSGETANIEEMLLQHILESNGFRITDSYDFYWNDNVIDVCFETDIPFKDYMDIERWIESRFYTIFKLLTGFLRFFQYYKGIKNQRSSIQIFKTNLIGGLNFSKNKISVFSYILSFI